MADDVLLKHSALIEELSFHLNAQHFEQIFAQRTAQLSKNEQFLIKMELKRLAQPCARIIDLRNEPFDDVQTYQYGSQQHFLDPLAIDAFEEALHTQGKYNFAVYEQVMHFVTEQRKNAHTQAIETPEVIKNRFHFASYRFREQERMNYTIKVTVDDGEKTRPAKTSDISLGGCKIKVADTHHYKEGQVVSMRLTGLEEDYELGLKQGINYEVVGSEPSNHQSFHYVRLKRLPQEGTAAFDQFLSHFIDGNKRRYKVNIDNTYDAVLTKGYEQFYLPKVNSLFSFLCAYQGPLKATTVLTSDGNQSTYDYFLNAQRQSMLGQILSEPRINALMANNREMNSAYLYCFTHVQNDDVFFYSATDSELATYPHLRTLFFAYASRKPSWQVFKLQVCKVDYEQAHIPLSLPDSTSETIAKLNRPPSARVHSHLKGLTYLCALTPIDNPTMHKRFSKLPLDKNSVNQLKVFGHHKAVKEELEKVTLHYTNLRAHPRYYYETPITVKTPDTQELTGVSKDFSVAGLQVALHQPSSLKRGDVIDISLPEMQKLTTKYRLTAMPYQIVGSNKTGSILNLKAYQRSKTPHQGVAFLSAVIKNNQEKLAPCEELPNVPGLARAMRNIVVTNMMQSAFYFNEHGQLIALGDGHHSNSFAKILNYFDASNSSTDLSSLLSEQAQKVIAKAVEQTHEHDDPIAIDLFCALTPKFDSLKQALNTHAVAIDGDYEKAREFVSIMSASSFVFTYRLIVNRAGRPDTKFLINELKYISQYAPHKAKEIETQLWQVFAVADVIEVDALLPHTLQLNANSYKDMVQKRSAWLAKL